MAKKKTIRKAIGAAVRIAKADDKKAAAAREAGTLGSAAGSVIGGAVAGPAGAALGANLGEKAALQAAAWASNPANQQAVAGALQSRTAAFRGQVSQHVPSIAAGNPFAKPAAGAQNKVADDNPFAKPNQAAIPPVAPNDDPDNPFRRQ